MMKPNDESVHTRTGNYPVLELVPEDALDLTLEQLLALIVCKIAEKPEDAKIEVINSQRIKVVELFVDKKDFAQVLGREGQTVKALRTIAKAILGSNNKQYNYRIELCSAPYDQQQQ